MAAKVGKGPFAGFIGMAALDRVRLKCGLVDGLQGQPRQTQPAKCWGVQPIGEWEKQWVSPFDQWSYGPAWSAWEGLIETNRHRGRKVTLPTIRCGSTRCCD